MVGRTLQKPLPNGGLPISPSPPQNGNHQQQNKLALKILLDKHLYLAGEAVTGQLEVKVLTDKLALGEIAIEFSGSEELRSLDHTSTRRLVFSKIDYQGSSLPPSAAVDPHALPLQRDYYPALKGRTRFPFSFTLPATLPSSCSLGSNATTRYELRAIANSLVGGNVDITSEKKEVGVVENWADWARGEWGKEVSKKEGGVLKLGGEGKLSVVAKVGGEGRHRLYWARDLEKGFQGNQMVEVRVKVVNASKRNISGLKLSLQRRLRILPQKGARPTTPAPLITQTILSDNFRGVGYEFAQGEEREVVIQTEVPLKECWSVRKGTLFELDALLRVEVECGFLSKDLAVELPIFIAHPLSLPPAAHVPRELPPTRLTIVPPSLPANFPTFPRSPSSHQDLNGQAAQPYTYPFGNHQEVYNEFGAIPPGGGGNGHTFRQSTIQDGSIVPNHHHHQHQPQPQHYHHHQQQQQTPYQSVSSVGGQPEVYFPPPPQIPLQLSGYGTPLPPPQQHQQQAYLAFDPTVPDLTQSRVLGYHQPPTPVQHYSPIPVVESYPPPPSEVVYSVPPPQPYHQPQTIPSRPPSRVEPVYSMRPPSVPPPSQSPHHYSHSPVPPPPREQGFTPPPPPPSHSYPHASYDNRSLHSQGLYQPREEPPRSPIYDISPPPLSPSPVPHSTSSPAPPSIPLQKTNTITSTRPMRTPPPPSPSSSMRYHPQPPSPTPSFLAVGGGQPLPTSNDLLETIGEDGESQAGTTKSVKLAQLLADRRSSSSGAISVVGEEDLRKPLASSPGRNSVIDLEEFVEDPVKMKEMSSPGGSRIEEWEVEEKLKKELPSPPVVEKPSSTSLPRAQDIFSKSPSPSTSPSPSPSPATFKALPSTPTSSRSPNPDIFDSSRPIDSPSRPTSASRRSPTREAGGLSALEARLARPLSPEISVPFPSTSTSNPSSPTKSSSSSTSNQLRTPATTNALRARSISRAGKEAELARSLATEEDPKEVLRKLGGESPKPIRRTTSISTVVVQEEVSMPAVATRERSPSLTPSISASQSPRMGDVKKVVEEEEVDGLKKDAVGRIGNWLVESKIQSSSSSTTLSSGEKTVEKEKGKRVLKRSTFDFVRQAPLPPSASTPSFSSAPTSKKPEPIEEPTVEELLANEPTPGFPSSVSTAFRERPAVGGGAGGLAVPRSLSVDDISAKYDHRSARGGRGGVVSSVAGLWAAKVDEEKEKAKPPPLLTVNSVPKALKVLPLSPSSLALAEENLHRSSPPPPSRPTPSSSSPSEPRSTPAPPRAGATNFKRWSQPVPAAKPFVNLTSGKPPAISRPGVGVEAIEERLIREGGGGGGGPAELRPAGRVTGGIAERIAKYKAELASLN